MVVNVLMSTYNGEKYVADQISSIFNQRGADIVLTIRDDGSKDHTLDILKELQKKYPDKIVLWEGENIGYARSFQKLLRFAQKDADYYAFADQDDIWLADKVLSGVNCLEQMQSDLGLYASSLSVCDEKLNVLYVNRMDLKISSLKSDFVRHCLAGCTMIFTDGLRKAVIKAVDENEKIIPSHDFSLSAVAYAYGEVYVDPNSHILHRRRAGSVTHKANGMMSRLNTECKIIFAGKDKSVRIQLAKSVYSLMADGWRMTAENEEFIRNVIHCREDRKSRRKMISDKNFSCGIKVCDLESRLTIMIGNY
jgi:rhamnosyltransferase